MVLRILRLAASGVLCFVAVSVPTLSPSAVLAEGPRAHAKQAHRGDGPRVWRYGRVWTQAHRRHVRRLHKRKPVAAFALPEQTLFPPYYESVQPWAKGPDVPGVIRGGLTVEQGSRWRSDIEGGRTVEQGSPWASRIEGGPTVEKGSRWRSRFEGGRTVEQGSPWASHMPNWTFSGTRAPVRPPGIPYYRTGKAPWSSGIRW